MTEPFLKPLWNSQSRLQSHLSNKELGFGRQVFEPEDYLVYNTIIEAIVRELVSDGIIVKQQKDSTPDDAEDRYEVTENLDKICKDSRDNGLSY